MEAEVRSLPIVAVVILASIGAPLAAAADVEEDARAQFDRGMELYDAAQYEEAAIAFERAYELKPSFKILYNWAQAENECGKYARALDAYQRYLREGGDDLDPERVEQVRAEIKRLESLVGTLLIKCPVGGATVLVDGVRVGTAPVEAPITVRLGEREVTVKHEGREIHREVVRIAGGEQVKVVVEAVPAPQPAVEPAPAPAPVTEDDGPKRVWTWVALGIGGAAGIAGGIVGGLSLKRTDDFIGECGDHTCPPSEADERDSIKTMSLTADILYGVAAAGIITGVILFFVEPDDEGDVDVAVAPSAPPGGAGLAVSGRF
jgi:hypothetical protein